MSPTRKTSISSTISSNSSQSTIPTSPASTPKTNPTTPPKTATATKTTTALKEISFRTNGTPLGGFWGNTIQNPIIQTYIQDYRLPTNSKKLAKFHATQKEMWKKGGVIRKAVREGKRVRGGRVVKDCEGRRWRGFGWGDSVRVGEEGGVGVADMVGVEGEVSE